MQIDLNQPGSTDNAFLDRLAQQAALALHAGGCAFYLRESERDCPSLAASYGFATAPWDEGLPEKVCESGEAILPAEPGRPAVLAVPVACRDLVRGVLIVVDDAPGRAYGEQDAAMLRSIADLSAAVLDQSDRLARMTAQFRALHVIDVALTSSLQLDRVLNLILDKAVTLVGAEHGSLRLWDENRWELVLRAHTGEGWTPEVQAYTFRPGHGITGWVAQHRKPCLCSDSLADPQNVVLFEEMRSGVAVPLLVGSGEPGSGGELLGVLLLESTRLAAFDRHDVELLAALAREAVIAIQNATHHEELQRMHQTLKKEQARRVAAEKWTVMGQAATSLAHRINNLIGIVPASAVQVREALNELEMPGADREWIAANLDRIERNSRFVLTLADALFRPFQEPGPRARFDVNRLLNEALEASGPRPDVQIVRDYGRQLPQVESNSLLVDIFVELITNAHKAMDDQPHKRLELRTAAESYEEEDWVVVQVGDTGRGISPERMAHLWDMFQPSAGGLGFGLWWVRTFLERQGGTIACESRAGEGTTFIVRLPVYVG